MRVSASAIGCAAQGVAVCASAVSSAAQRMAVIASGASREVVAVSARRDIVMTWNSRIRNWIPSRMGVAAGNIGVSGSSVVVWLARRNHIFPGMGVRARVASRTSVRMRPGVRSVAAHIVRMRARVAGVARHVMGVRAIAGCCAGYAVRVARKICLSERDGVGAASCANGICVASANHKEVSKVWSSIGAVADHPARWNGRNRARPYANNTRRNALNAGEQGAIYSWKLCGAVELNDIVGARADIERGCRSKSEICARCGVVRKIRQVVGCDQVVRRNERRTNINNVRASASTVTVHNCTVTVEYGRVRPGTLTDDCCLTRGVSKNKNTL